MGTEEHEHVWEVGDGDAPVGVHAFGEGGVQLQAVLADDAHGGEAVGGAEAGAVDDDVHGGGRTPRLSMMVRPSMWSMPSLIRSTFSLAMVRR